MAARTFLLPLLINKHCRVPLRQVFLAHLDGIDPEAVYSLLGAGQRLKPAFLFTVSVPTWLAGKAGAQPKIYQRRSEAPDKAAFILSSTMRHLEKQLNRAAPASVSSTWSDYMETKSYCEDGFDAKERFVREALEKGKPETVLDIGCNTGHFSELAARHASHVVAIDSDPVCVGRTYERAVARSLSVLPLVADIARPSAAMGWRNREQASLIDRLTGRFDLVLMLAVLHHLLVTERIPIREILKLASDFTRDRLVLEYVGPGDEMFRKLVRGRDELYAHMTIEWFEAACQEFFEVVAVKSLEPQDRRLYLLRKKRGLAPNILTSH
jgi:SAM-dependent methyltransferase